MPRRTAELRPGRSPVLPLLVLSYAFAACSDASPPGSGADDAGGTTTTDVGGADGDAAVGSDGGSSSGADGGDTGTSADPDGGGGSGDGGSTDIPTDVGTTPLNPGNRMRDSDCDGLSDQFEFSTVYPDGSKTDPLVADTDGDGLPDGLEIGVVAAVAGWSCATPPTLDADPTSLTSPVIADTDGDGLSDGLEDTNGNGRVDTGETDPRLRDTDSDGLADGVEDTNRNGQLDSGETDPTLADSDADGLPDGVEDLDRDGVRDPGELDPTNPDTDGERLLDGAEDINQNGVAERFETDGTNPDTDCDGLDDYIELNQTPMTSPVNPDTDGDGIGDGVELGVTSAVAGSGCPAPAPNDADPTTMTDPTNRDSDGDGLDDGVEDTNGNGRVDAGETDPNDSDSDNDGVNDGDEVRAGFDPLDGAVPGTGAATGINDICSDSNLKVVDFDRQTTSWTLATEQSTAYQAITVSSAGSGVSVAALDDSTNAVAGFVLEMPLLSGAANLATQVAAVESRVTAGVTAEGLTYTARTSPRNITSHDGFPSAVSGIVDLAVGANRNAAAIRNAMIRLVTGLPASAFTGLPTATGSGTRAYVYGYQVLLRNTSGTTPTLVVVGAVLEQTAFDTASDRKSIIVSDLVNGTALAEADATRDKDCDPFTAQGVAVADFVWMADVSGSTDDDRGRITQAAQLIFQELTTNNVDFRMGVVPHWQNDFRLGTNNGGNLRGNGFTTSQSQFVTDLQNTANTDGCEYGLEAASNAIRRALPRTAAGTTNARRFRDDATIAVVYISDEYADEVQDAQCYGRTLPCSTNIDDLYGAGGNASCGNTPNQTCVDRIVAPYAAQLATESAVAFAQVIAPNAAYTTCAQYACGSDANEPGRGYVEVVNSTGGAFYSPCSSTPGSSLRSIIDAVTGAASQFQLTGNPISSTIRVGVVRSGTTNVVPRDKQDGFDYDAASNSIFFRGTNYAPAQGELVVISYRLWEPPPASCPPGQVLDPTLNICVCDMATCNANCGPNEVCDSSCNCACSPSCNGNCAAGEVCNQATCACECPSDCGGCPSGTTCNQNTCQCECSDCGGACAGTNTTCNTTTCQCECGSDCGGACGGNTVCNDSLCECVCPADCDAQCPGLATCDLANGCACECPANCGDTCTGSATCNSTACACECPADCDASCSGNETCNPANGCACECAADCGGNCGTNEYCDVATCTCEPRS